MKSLKLHFESLLDDDDAFYDPENDKKAIEDWIKDNYNFSGKLTISDDLVVDCDKYVYVKNRYITSLTNGLFRWGYVGGNFVCNYCTKLKTLEGAPKKTMGYFDCGHCSNLKTLKGAPEYIGGDFDCNKCVNLTTLEGAPKETDGYFCCSHCDKLETLKGARRKVGGYFSCSHCDNLTSLKGAPEEIDGDLYCFGCKNLKITDSDRIKYKIEN